MTQTNMTTSKNEKFCECGAPLEGEYIPPKFINGKKMPLTDITLYDEYCQKCKEQNEKIKQLENRYKKMISSGAYPKQFQMTFNKFDGDESVVKMLKDDFVKNRNFNVYLYGPCGVGKTHLLSAVLNELVNRNIEVRYFRITDLLNKIKDLMVNSEPTASDDYMIELIKSKKVLLIDDLGAEKATDVVLEKLYTLFDYIELYIRKGIIITSNLSLKQLSEKLGDRIASRIAGNFKIKELKGGDRRVRVVRDKSQKGGELVWEGPKKS